jgi:hypothetical protein
MPVLFLLLLGDSPASEFYMPTFLPAYNTYQDGTECSETSAYEIQTPGNHQKRKNTFRTRRIFEIKEYNYKLNQYMASP